MRTLRGAREAGRMLGKTSWKSTKGQRWGRDGVDSQWQQRLWCDSVRASKATACQNLAPSYTGAKGITSRPSSASLAPSHPHHHDTHVFVCIIPFFTLTKITEICNIISCCTRENSSLKKPGHLTHCRQLAEPGLARRQVAISWRKSSTIPRSTASGFGWGQLLPVLRIES